MRTWLCLLVAVAAATATLAVPTARATQVDAASQTVWLCRPHLANNPCALGLGTTIQRADGTSRVVHPARARRKKVDCFYVYPTVSHQPGPNANLHIDPEQIAVAQAQASRFTQVCRMFAPMYPQLTIGTINNGGAGAYPQAVAKAYLGVLSAWRDYLAHDNRGRGVILIGHSQGAGMLMGLLKREIEPNADQRRLLVSALLIGGPITVPVGADVGGSFQRTPACRTLKQVHCVVAYNSFNETPPANARFGRATVPGEQTLCVNPAAPAGGTVPLHPFFRTAPFPGPTGSLPSPYQASTPWVQLPNLYTAHCVYEGGASWLQIDDIGGPTDHRPRVQNVLGPTWGLHLVDVNLALGDLVDLARRQAANAYR